MAHLDTLYPVIIFKQMPLLDPTTIYRIMDKCTKTHERIHFRWNQWSHISSNIQFVIDISSSFLDLYEFKHSKDIWYMDCIRYNLKNIKTGVSSKLAWHCENDLHNNLITVLFYLRKDSEIKNGDLEYKDKNGNIKILEINSGTTIIMDGRVEHKPQDPYGSGRRDLIIVNFRNY